MIITRSSLRAMFKGFQVLFKSGMGMAEPWGSKVARTLPSTGEEETYSWLTAIPGLRHWVGPRVVENLRSRSFTIKNKPFEKTLGVEREKIEDDKYGMYGDYASLLGQQAAAAGVAGVLVPTATAVVAGEAASTGGAGGLPAAIRLPRPRPRRDFDATAMKLIFLPG